MECSTDLTKQLSPLIFADYRNKRFQHNDRVVSEERGDCEAGNKRIVVQTLHGLPRCSTGSRFHATLRNQAEFLTQDENDETKEGFLASWQREKVHASTRRDSIARRRFVSRVLSRDRDSLCFSFLVVFSISAKRT